MEPDSEAKGADTEVTDDDGPAEAIRWLGDARRSGHHADEEHANGDAEVGVDSIAADSNGNGVATNVDRRELDGPSARDADHAMVDDGGGDEDDEDDDTNVDTGHRGPELITISGGGFGDGASAFAPVVSRDPATGRSDDLGTWDDDDWDDDDWDDEPAVATDRYAHTTSRPEHLTLAEVLHVRSARMIGITIVVTFVAVVMATVLLWQRVEDTRAEVARSKQVTSVPGLAGVNRRLNRLETEIAAILGSPTGDPTGRADAIQQQLTSLNQCVADFQHAIVSGKRSSVRYC